MFKCIYTFIDNNKRYVAYFSNEEMYNFMLRNYEQLNWFDCYNTKGERTTLI